MIGLPEIDELQVVVGRDHDVARLQVEMHHVVLLKIAQGLGQQEKDADLGFE